MPESTKDPRQYTQCWCHKCRGGTVTKRTEYNHRAHPRAPVAPTSGAHSQNLAEASTVVSGDNNNRIEEGEAADRRAKKCRVDEDVIPVPSNEQNDFYEQDFGEIQSNVKDNRSVSNEPREVTTMLNPPFPLPGVGLPIGVLDENTRNYDVPSASEPLGLSSPPGTPAPLVELLDQTDLASHSDPESDFDQNESHHGGDYENGPFRGEDEEAFPYIDSSIDHILLCQKYIQQISSATLENGKLDKAVIERLRNPEKGSPDISDPDIRLSIDLFLACANAADATYHSARDAFLRRLPESEVLSHYRVKKLVAEISGVVSVLDDMCINSCEAFVGPKADYEACSICLEPRYKMKKSKQVPCQQMITIPLGPQIQALRRSSEGATAMGYRDQIIRELLGVREDERAQNFVYDDIFLGSELLDLFKKSELGPQDTTVSFSLDGAQLYQNKKSDTWIAIWIINDYHPTLRYKRKHVLPALVVPGPNKPKDLDSFMFRSFHHLSAIQRENSGAGIHIWDALLNTTSLSRIFFILGTADAVGLTELDGRVGHHGAQGCRMSCNMKGRHKPRSGHYFSAHLRPNGTNADDCNHGDYNFRAAPQNPSSDTYQVNISKVVASTNQTDFEKNRKLTGLSKPSIVSGLDPTKCLVVPHCFTVDLMHLLTMNLGELIIPIWRGEFKCETTDNKATWDWVVLTGDAWLNHGKLVAAATKFFPSSFHRPPRNPAEKISSGYKASEYFLYLFGLGPAFFRVLLPEKYWIHFCKLVHGIRIITQRSITGFQLREAHSYLTQFVEQYEHLYYQRRMDRLHFCRPCLHTLLHTAPECARVGPGTYSTQYTMERSIGDLGGEIRQPSNMYGNLCQIALRRSQINALKKICPEFDPPTSIPSPFHDCGGGFVILRPRSRNPITLAGILATVVDGMVGRMTVRKWGRLQLPNGQIARSVFAETEVNRVSRNVKFKLANEIHFGEVQFYFLDEADDGHKSSYAVISVYGPPNMDMLAKSSHVLWAAAYTGDTNLHVVETMNIISVVSMQPLPRKPDDPENLWFVVEKSGLDDTELTGYVDPVNSPDVL